MCNQLLLFFFWWMDPKSPRFFMFILTTRCHYRSNCMNMCHYVILSDPGLMEETCIEVSSKLAPHEFHETCHSVTFYLMKKKDSKRCCDTSTPESIHTKDESKRGSAFAFIFGVNWPVQWMQRNDKFYGIHDLCIAAVSYKRTRKRGCLASYFSLHHLCNHWLHSEI